jgi:hypothetical protein
MQIKNNPKKNLVKLICLIKFFILVETKNTDPPAYTLNGFWLRI